MRCSVSVLASLTLACQGTSTAGQTPRDQELMAISREPIPSPFTLPPPFMVASDSERRFGGYQPPPPLRGLIVHGHFYNNYSEGAQWLSPQAEREAREQCGARLRFPEHSEDANGNRIVSRFWIIRSENEQAQFSYLPRYTGTNGCVVQLGYGLEVERVLLRGDFVTRFQKLHNGGWSAVTIPRDGRYDLPDLVETTDRFAWASKKYVKRSYRPDNSLGVKQLCFHIGSSLDRDFECYLDQRGPWRGLLLRRHGEHTATFDAGMQVDQIALDGWIDSRLFEWDRSVTTSD